MIRIRLPRAEVERLEQESRSTEGRELRDRLPIILLAHRGRKHQDIAAELGIHRRSVRRWLNADLERGLRGLRDSEPIGPHHFRRRTARRPIDTEPGPVHPRGRSGTFAPVGPDRPPRGGRSGTGGGPDPATGESRGGRRAPIGAEAARGRDRAALPLGASAWTRSRGGDQPPSRSPRGVPSGA